jgi:hypothetical protein
MWASKFVGNCLYLTFVGSTHVLCIKFAQMKVMFVCDLMIYYQGHQGDSYNMYYEHISIFIENTFWAFKFCLNTNMKILRCDGYLILILEFKICLLR